MENCCPSCKSQAIKKNGYTRHGKQNHRCLDCGRQFSLEPAFPAPVNAQTPQEDYLIECRVIG
jgi:transposase-like protein